jgi:hypothetical protein
MLHILHGRNILNFVITLLHTNWTMEKFALNAISVVVLWEIISAEAHQNWDDIPEEDTIVTVSK